MTPKLLEVRDRGTFVPVMAIAVSGDDGYLMRRAGFQSRMVYLVHLTGQKAQYDPYAWDNRTMANAHQYIVQNWDHLKDGDVVDVEFILGETQTAKRSEQETLREDPYGEW